MGIPRTSVATDRLASSLNKETINENVKKLNRFRARLSQLSMAKEIIQGIKVG